MNNLLKQLCAISGISGDEGKVSEFIIENIKDYCSYHKDALGNVICFKKGKKTPKNKVLFSAHMDEVGFIVTSVNSDGTLNFTNVGGVDPKVTIGKVLLVGEKLIPGVVSLKPVHLLSEEEHTTIPKISDLTIDIGADSKEEALNAVEPGDTIIFESDFVNFGDGFIKAKALDDRCGCYMLINLLRSELEYDCYFSFTVQEEIGCVGGKTAAFGVKPDIAVAIETTTAGDLALTPEHKKVCRVGNGPVVSFMDRGTIYDRELFKFGMNLAKENDIPVQTKEGVFGGNESRSLQSAAEGARVMAVSLPGRYIHSASCVLKESDIENCEKLLKLLSERLAEI